MLKLILSLLLAVSVFSAYDQKLAYEMGLLSEVAYESSTSISGWTCGPCQKIKITDVKVFVNSTENIQGFVGYNPTRNAIVAAFRGSVDIKNWITDFNAEQLTYKSCSGCKVHAGFYSAYSLVSSVVRGQVQLLASKYRGATIMVTGHSLGGAIAVVAALDIKENYGHVDAFYTYGQPRVGNSLFASYFNSQITNAYRVIHYADIVPHVPPSNLLDYKHSNTEAWFTETMQSKVLCTAEDPKCSNSLPPTSLSTSDHELTSYMKMPLANPSLVSA